MQGSEPGKFFKSDEKIGKLFIKKRRHTIGNTLQIFVLPSEDADADHPDAVEVYGVISGLPGWAEVYGWIHHGPWVSVFEDIVEQRKQKLLEKIELEKQKKETESLESKARKQETLDLFGVESIELEKIIFEEKVNNALADFLSKTKISLDDYTLSVQIQTNKIDFCLRPGMPIMSRIGTIETELFVKRKPR